MIDLLSATQGAVFRALEAAVSLDLGEVLQVVPENRQPPFLCVGVIESDSEATKGDQLEMLRVEVISVYRGDRRSVLLQMMHAAREALDRQPIAADGVYFQPPRYVSATAGRAMADGVTYAGIVNFEIYAEPA